MAGLIAGRGTCRSVVHSIDRSVGIDDKESLKNKSFANKECVYTVILSYLRPRPYSMSVVGFLLLWR